MADFKQSFIDYLTTQNLSYARTDKDTVYLKIRGKNWKDMPVSVSFNTDGIPCAHFYCPCIANFKDDIPLGLIGCNEMNKLYRWATFFIFPHDGNVFAKTDTFFHADTCGQDCARVLKRFVRCLDDAYPKITTLGSSK